MSQDDSNITISNDLSSTEPLPPYKKDLIAEELRGIQDRIKFRRWLFYSLGIGSILLFLVLMTYIALPFFYPSSVKLIPLPERLMILGILAAMTIIIPLALLRVIYLPTKTQEDSGDSISIWQGLVKELLDILRQYLDKKSN